MDKEGPLTDRESELIRETTESELKSWATKLRAKVPVTEHEWLTPQEVAAILRVSTATVFRQCRSGQIPHMRIGRLVRINKRDLLPVSEQSG